MTDIDIETKVKLLSFAILIRANIEQAKKDNMDHNVMDGELGLISLNGKIIMQKKDGDGNMFDMALGD
ncbi:hypothetical protein QKT26_gp25 [Carcinus maenas nudivirus]|uniref:Uncharacterized protein n=1 Tax=Carcinus maenas nudivirus TaxID=2880837 RepID=A0AAE8Y544_9VIRU|nr:hypothetical protein QKT26_gp25 [Carcinus maenas nudivirus]UBZ25615.1 hypothetical protein CmNV_025 [Carcinus maenas nudivirus]